MVVSHIKISFPYEIILFCKISRVLWTKRSYLFQQAYGEIQFAITSQLVKCRNKNTYIIGICDYIFLKCLGP